MRRLRWLLTGLALLLVCVLAGLWLSASLLDWNRYRDEIAALASARIGRPVRIAGPVSLILLPQPTLTASGVSLMDAGGGVTVTAAQMRLRVALGPLLAGRVDARDLTLRGLDVKVPWQPGPGGLGPAVLAMPPPDWLAALSARIERGRLSIGGLVIGNIEATLATSDTTGSYVAAGTARISGHAWHFTARLTRPGGDGAVGIDLSLDGQDKAVGLGATLTGQISRDGTLTGRIAGRGPDLSQLMPAPAVAFRAEGRVNVAGGLAVADQLTGEIGGSPGSGAVALRLDRTPRLDVAVMASRLDLDAWAPALLRAAAAGALHDLPIGIDLSAEAAQLAGGTLRRLRGAFDVADGTVLVREARALLPGDAQLRLSGRILPPGAGAVGGVRFDGTAALWAPALRTTLAWAAAAAPQAGLVGRLPPLALRSLQIAGHLQADAGGIGLDRIHATLDGGAMSGDVALRFGPQPQMKARLVLDRLDLDPWLPDPLPTPAGLAASLGGLRLGGLRLELDLRAATAQLQGQSLAGWSIQLGLQSGRLTLQQLTFAVDGVQASLAGTLLEGGRLADGRLDLRTARAAPLAALLPGWFGDSPLLAWLWRAPIWLGPAALQVQAAGTAEALALRLTGDLGDLRLEAQPVLDFSRPAWRWSGPFTLRHPGAPRLAMALGLTGAPKWLGDGSLSLITQFAAQPGHISLTDFTLTAGGLHATGSLDLEPGRSGGPALTGRVMADQLPMPPFDPHDPDPLPLGLLQGWQGAVRLEATRVLAGAAAVLHKASATLALQGGTLRLEGLSARVDGGALALRASLDSNASPPVLALRGTLTGAVLAAPLLDQPFDVTAGTMDITANLAASGFAPAALLTSLAGSVTAKVRDGALVGLSLPAAVAALQEAPEVGDPHLAAALAGGSMGFDRLDLSATLAHGTVQFDRGQLAAPSGSIGIEGTFSLPDLAATLRLELHPQLATPPGTAAPPVLGLRIGGTLAAPKRAPELSDLIRWRAERGP